MIESSERAPANGQKPVPHDHSELEALRLDRLQRAARRRHWDSVLAARPREPGTEAPTLPLPGPASPSTPVAPARPQPTSTDLLALIELMTDRLDRVERLACRLDDAARRRDRRDRRGRRLFAAGVGLTALVVALAPVAWTLGLFSLPGSPL